MQLVSLSFPLSSTHFLVPAPLLCEFYSALTMTPFWTITIKVGAICAIFSTTVWFIEKANEV